MSPARVAQAADRARALLERVLRPGGASSLAAEYPLVFDGRFAGRVVAHEEDGDARSACATLVRELVFDGARLRVGMIGSVATDSAWRGRGLASGVLDEAEGLLAREGCAAALLWADQPELYAGRGYRPFGWEVDFLLPTEALRKLAPRATVRALAPDDKAAVHRAYARHASRVDRSPEETAALLGCPGMETLVLQRDRDVAAYACLGRGADFGGTVHEWAGAADDVVALLAEHARRLAPASAAEALALIAPPSACGLRERLVSLGAQASDGVLAMAKVLDADALGELFDRFAGGWRAERDARHGSRAALTLRGPRAARAVGGEEALELLFAPRGERSAIAELEQALGAPARHLPLMPFVWGLDSI